MMTPREIPVLSWLIAASLCAGFAASPALRSALPPMYVWGAIGLASVSLGVWHGCDLRSRLLHTTSCLVLLSATALFAQWYVAFRQQLLVVELALPVLAALPLGAFAHVALGHALGARRRGDGATPRA